MAGSLVPNFKINVITHMGTINDEVIGLLSVLGRFWILGIFGKYEMENEN
jgi:hypothetical protein